MYNRLYCSPPSSTTMPEPTHLLLLSVGNGMVLAHDGTRMVARHRDDYDRTQRWIVELDEKDEKYFALKNVGLDRYMRANNNYPGTPIVAGEKQWWFWSVEDAAAPGALRIGVKEYPETVLNHQDGRFVPRGQNALVQIHNWDVSRHAYLTCAKPSR